MEVILSTALRPRVKADTPRRMKMNVRRRRPRTAVDPTTDEAIEHGRRGGWRDRPFGAHGGISRVNNWSRASGLRSACLPATNWLLEAARIILQHALGQA